MDLESPDKNQALTVVIEKLTEIIGSISQNKDTTIASTDRPRSREGEKGTLSFVRMNELDTAHAVGISTEQHASPNQVVINLPVKVGKVSITDTEGLLESLKQLDQKGKSDTLKKDKGDEKTSDTVNKDFYKCSKCDYSSHNKHYLKQHVDLVHTSERPFKCPLCDYAGKRSHSLKEHLVVHSPYRPFTCPFCSASFRKKGHMTNHIKLHASEQAVACSICKHFIANRSELSRHLIQAHVGGDIYTCDMCEYATTTDIDIIVHMHSHGRPNVYSCSECKFTAVHEGIMEKHISTNHKTNATFTVTKTTVKTGPLVLLKCSECGFTTSDRETLKEHMYTKHIDCSSSSTKLVVSEMNTGSSGGAATNKSAATTTTPQVTLLKKSDLQATNLPLSRVIEIKPEVEGNDKDDESKMPVFTCKHCPFTCNEAIALWKHMQSHPVVNEGGANEENLGNVSMSSLSEESMKDGFMHDKSAGLYCCLICGYTGHQRTIKAHVWKHSGHKDMKYPTFQNGPISIYNANSGESVNVTSSVEVPSQLKMIKEGNLAESDDTRVKYVRVIPQGTSAFRELSEPETTKISKNDTTDSSHHKIVEIDPTIVKTEIIIEDSEKAETAEDTETSSPNSGADNKPSAGKKRPAPVEPSEMDKSMPKIRIIDNEKKSSGESSPRTVPFPVSTVFPASGQNVIVQRMSPMYPTPKFTIKDSRQNSPQGSPACSSPRDDAPSTVSNEASPPASDDEDTAEVEMHYTEEGSSEDEMVIEECVEVAEHADCYEEVVETTGDTDRCNGDEEKDTTNEESDKERVSLRALLQRQHSSGDLEKDFGKQREALAARPRSGSLDGEGQHLNQPEQGRISSSLLAVIEQFRNDASKVTNADPTETYIDATTEKIEKCLIGKPNDEETKSCSLCSFTAETTKQLLEHVLKHCKFRGYRCKLCSCSFATKGHLRTHMAVHNMIISEEFSSESPLILCASKTKTPGTITAHQIQPQYVCENCEGIFTTIDGLLKHKTKRICWNKPSVNSEPTSADEKDCFKCNFCDFVGMSVRSLKSHMKRHWNDLRSSQQQEENVDTESDSSAEHRKRYVCERCASVFNSLMDLLAHKPETCSGRIPTCSECNFKSANLELFKKHMHYHGKMYKCQMCDFVSKSYNKMDSHVKIHIEPQDLHCTLCDFIATSVRSLKSHMKRHTNDQRFVRQPLEQYKCNMCGYICHHLPALKSHMWRHASDNSYSYEKTNAVINAALENLDEDQVVDERKSQQRQSDLPPYSAVSRPVKDRSCLIAFRCCHCFFETSEKKVLNEHMKCHSDIIQKTIEVNNDLFCARSSQPTEAATSQGTDS